MSDTSITAIIGDIANKKSCGGNETANTGKLGCLQLFGTPEHFIGVKKGYKIQATQDITLAWITGKVQDGTFTPIVGASAFEDMSAEDAYSTNSSGEKRINLKGLPEYKLMFEEGHEFYRQLARIETYKSMDFIILDDEGNWMLAQNSDGSYSGFRAGHVTPELTKRKVKGGDAESKSLVVQFLDRKQFDTNYAIIQADNIPFVPEEIPLVNGVNLAFINVPAAGVALDISTVLSADNSTTIEGLTTLTDWYVTVDGVDNPVTAVTSSASGVYQLTVSTLSIGDVVVVDLATATTSVVDSSGVLYRSTSITDTVA